MNVNLCLMELTIERLAQRCQMGSIWLIFVWDDWWRRKLQLSNVNCQLSIVNCQLTTG
ncbi:MAG: hypothetical protein ACRC62_24270 [Microcoleus sp.]